MKSHSYNSLLPICLFLVCSVFPIFVTGFHNQQHSWSTITTKPSFSSSSSSSSSSLAFSNNNKGDKLREATGIRPSLHPTTINAIADALKARAMKKNKDDGMVFRVSDTVQPIDVAITAGQIASTAIAKRQQSSEDDGMKLTPKEELSFVFCFCFLGSSVLFFFFLFSFSQLYISLFFFHFYHIYINKKNRQTIAGRVLGVIMRLDELELKLYDKVSNVDWIAKYNEWSTFGVLPKEEDNSIIDERIRDDPLFTLSRAECLLAIFLQTVEIPGLEKANETVPDGSKIDFLDEDRSNVLLG